MKGTQVEDQLPLITILSNASGWAAAIFFGRMALKDRDKQLELHEQAIKDGLKWQTDHEKGHVTSDDIQRIYEENRDSNKRVERMIAESTKSAQENFRHITSRVDEIAGRSHDRRQGDQ